MSWIPTLLTSWHLDVYFSFFLGNGKINVKAILIRCSFSSYLFLFNSNVFVGIVNIITNECNKISEMNLANKNFQAYIISLNHLNKEDIKLNCSDQNNLAR